ncbi:secernin-1 [Anomaloglossus baeobatrachus]|uniref:secernin-1 n=1 Tax=Anomaloglossus baeobatrachus TaxID=238106 RepID=UPI003F507717
MTAPPPSYCFVALPPRTSKGHIVFGKNSTRPRDEVQEVLHVPSSTHEAGSKVQCTYLSIDQVAKTHSMILSKPAWMWGAEMGANEYGVCIGNADVITKQAADDGTLLLGADLVRLGLERGTSAKEAVDVISSLLEEHGQGGSNFQTDGQSFHSAFLIVDRTEAWILETVGKLWAAERITDGIRCICNHLSLKTHIDLEHPELRSHAQDQGWWNEDKEFNFSEVFSEHRHIDDCFGKEAVENQEELMTVESMINVLRNKSSGICVDSNTFLTTASAVSVLPKDDKWPCIHFVTGTPDPSRSVFKPFIFVEDIKAVPMVQSSCVRGNTCDHDHSQWKHELYEAHQCALSLMDKDKEEGDQLQTILLDLEKQGLEAMEDLLNSSNPLDPAEVVDLFYDCVDTEIKFYK